MNLLLFFAGAAVVYLLQLLFFRLVWHYRLQATASFSETTATEGDTLQLTEVVENRKLLPVPTVKVNIALDKALVFQDASNLVVSDKNYRSEIFALRAYERVSREIPIFCERRGLYTIGDLDLVGSDLFYSHSFVLHRHSESTLCVYPGRVDGAMLVAVTRRIMGESVVRRSDTDDPFTFRGIRPYESFDSMKDINWKASAKTGELRVNMHDYTANQEISIVLDTEWDSLLRPDSILEESIRIAASLADEFIADGIPTSLYTNGRDRLNGDFFSLSGGAGESHGDAIRRGLACIDIPATVSEATLPNLLRDLKAQAEEEPSRQRTWVLISSETNEAVLTAWKELADSATTAFRIIPCDKGEEESVSAAAEEELICWGVPRGK